MNNINNNLPFNNSAYNNYQAGNIPNTNSADINNSQHNNVIASLSSTSPTDSYQGINYSETLGIDNDLGALYSSIAGTRQSDNLIPETMNESERIFCDLMQMAMGNSKQVYDDAKSVAFNTFRFGEVNPLQDINGRKLDSTQVGNPLISWGSNTIDLGNTIYASQRQRQHLDKLHTLLRLGNDGIEQLLQQIFPNMNTAQRKIQAKLLNKLVNERCPNWSQDINATGKKITAVEESLNTDIDINKSIMKKISDRFKAIIKGGGQ